MPQKTNKKEVTNKKEDTVAKKQEIKTNAKNNKFKKVESESESSSDSDSDKVSDINEDEITDDMVSKDAMSKLEESFKEKVIKYIKIDDLMRKETIDYREKMNTLKEEKEELQTYMLRYLDTMEQETVNIAGTGKLSKCESIRKGTINKDLIKQAICEQLKKDKIVKDDKTGKELAENTYNLMESKREIKKKVYIKRTFERPKKEKQAKKNKKGGSKK